MSENLAIWHAVEKTDPAFVKAITGKAYKGSSPSPHWIKMRLTETFGPAGIGWGTEVLSETFLPVGEKTMHYLRIKLWFVHEGKRGEIEEFGGTELGGKRKDGNAFADEDAPKKSMTDALVKAASSLGFAADIFLGRWDDSKYVEQRAAEAQVENKANAQARALADEADLKQQVGGIMTALESVENEAALTLIRSQAAQLRPDLQTAGMKDAIADLGSAIQGTMKRLGINLPARAA